MSSFFGLALWLGLAASAQPLPVKQAGAFPPEYPEIARRWAIEGTVVLAVTVAQDGRVVNVRRISGYPVLAAPAMRALKQRTWAPEIVDGRPSASTRIIELRFTLP